MEDARYLFPHGDAFGKQFIIHRTQGCRLQHRVESFDGSSLEGRGRFAPDPRSRHILPMPANVVSIEGVCP